MCALASRAASPGIGIAKSSSSVKSVTACIPFAACSLRRALCIRAFGGTDPSAAMQLSRFAMQKKPSNANHHFSKRTFTPRTCSRPVAVRWSSECSANLKAIECTFTPRRLRCPSCVAMRVDLQCSLRSLDARSHLGFAAVRLHCDGGGSHQSGRRRHVCGPQYGTVCIARLGKPGCQCTTTTYYEQASRSCCMNEGFSVLPPHRANEVGRHTERGQRN